MRRRSSGRSSRQPPDCRASIFPIRPDRRLVAFSRLVDEVAGAVELGGCTVIGPLLVGLNKPIQIVGLNAKDSDIVNMAAIAAYSAGT